MGSRIPDQAAVVGQSFSYTFPSNSFSDADGDDLTYTATKPNDTALPEWLTFTNSSSTPRHFSGTPQSTDTGTLSVKVTASDGNGGSVSDTFNIVVNADTAPAFADGTTIPDQSWTVDTEITALTLPAATGGNGTVSYELTPALPTGVILNGTTGVVSGTPTLAAAQATYTWRAKDSDSNTANADTAALTFQLTVNKATLTKPTNLALKANSTTRTGFTVTWDAVSNASGYTATAAPTSGTSVTVTLPTASANPEAVFTGLAMNTTYTVTVVATGDANYENSEASDGQSVTTLANQALTVAIAIPDQAATASIAIPDQAATVGTAFEYVFPSTSFNGADGDTLSYEAQQTDGTTDSALPSWLTFTAAERKLAGTPQASDTGTLKVKVTASDGNGKSVSGTFDIVVTVIASADDGKTVTADITFPPVAAPPLTEATLHYMSAPRTLTVGTTITMKARTTLTAPVAYAVTPDLPAGLTLNMTTGEISGKPTTINPDAVTVTVTASADDGETATADITFPPVTAPPLTEERRDEVNTEILPSIINQVAQNQVSVITGRSEFISSGLNRENLSMEEVATDVVDYLFSHHQDIQANGFDWRQALSGNNFSFALAGSGAPQGSMDNGELSSSSAGPLSFWGAIDYSSLQDNIETISLDGDALSFNFGIDKELTSDLLLGILLSIDNSEFELTGGFTGTYEVDLSTLNPYISWEASEDLSLWASVGYGRGQVDLTETSSNDTISQGGNFTRFSAGGSFQLWQSETGTALALKLDGTAARFLGEDVQRSRLATEFSHDFSMDSGVLNTALELGLLMSSADESAAELVGRLHWQGAAGLSTSVQSRVLLGGGDRQEWGIGGALRYTAGDGEGLMMSLEPSFGISNPQLLPDLWSATTSNLSITREAPTARLNAAIAYGFPTTGGLLTPYTDLSFSDTTSTYGAGLRYGLPTGWTLDLKGTHKTTTEDPENSILLELEAEL